MHSVKAAACAWTRSQCPFLSPSYLVSSVEPFPLLLSLQDSKILSSGGGGRGAGINCNKKVFQFLLPPGTPISSQRAAVRESQAQPAPHPPGPPNTLTFPGRPFTLEKGFSACRAGGTWQLAPSQDRPFSFRSLSVLSAPFRARGS